MIHARGLVQTFETRQGRTKTEVRAVDDVDLDTFRSQAEEFFMSNYEGDQLALYEAIREGASS